MSRNAGTAPSGPRRGPRWPQLRQASAGHDHDHHHHHHHHLHHLHLPHYRQRIASELSGSPGSSSTHSTIREDRSRRRAERYCHVAVIEGYARDEVLLNLDLLGGDVKPGALVSIMSPSRGEAARAVSGPYGSVSKQPPHDHCDASRGPSSDHDCQHNRYVFVAKDMPAEMKARQPDAEVCVVKHIADAFGMKKGSPVLFAPVRPPPSASYSPSPLMKRPTFRLIRATP